MYRKSDARHIDERKVLLRVCLASDLKPASKDREADTTLVDINQLNTDNVYLTTRPRVHGYQYALRPNQALSRDNSYRRFCICARFAVCGFGPVKTAKGRVTHRQQ